MSETLLKAVFRSVIEATDDVIEQFAMNPEIPSEYLFGFKDASEILKEYTEDLKDTDFTGYIDHIKSIVDRLSEFEGSPEYVLGRNDFLDSLTVVLLMQTYS